MIQEDGGEIKLLEQQILITIEVVIINLNILQLKKILIILDD